MTETVLIRAGGHERRGNKLKTRRVRAARAAFSTALEVLRSAASRMFRLSFSFNLIASLFFSHLHSIDDPPIRHTLSDRGSLLGASGCAFLGRRSAPNRTLYRLWGCFFPFLLDPARVARFREFAPAAFADRELHLFVPASVSSSAGSFPWECLPMDLPPRLHRSRCLYVLYGTGGAHLEHRAWRRLSYCTYVQYWRNKRAKECRRASHGGICKPYREAGPDSTLRLRSGFLHIPKGKMRK